MAATAGQTSQTAATSAETTAHATVATPAAESSPAQPMHSGSQAAVPAGQIDDGAADVAPSEADSVTTSSPNETSTDDADREAIAEFFRAMTVHLRQPAPCPTDVPLCLRNVYSPFQSWSQMQIEKLFF